MKKCRNVGFQQAGTLAYLESSSVSEGAPGSYALQRLYSTFPGGRPGIGLLLLRAAVGFAATAGGIFYLSGPSNPSSGTWLLGLVLIAGGAALAAGFLTPFAALFVGLCFLGIALAWFPAPSWSLHDARTVAIGMIITAAALALLGPGAFSLDGRLFGRREIVIPPSSRPPES
jgi:uncharacterized membrane protein YphA (DoxX/SURF4 family)